MIETPPGVSSVATPGIATEAEAQLPDGYQVLNHIRRGTVLDVYDIWSEERACRCVAKVLRPDRLADTRARARLLREGRLLLRLSHPHLVRAYAVHTRPVPTVILETLTGATLSQLLSEHPAGLPVPDVAALGLHLCSAIHYLHAHNILHLDLKPSNIVCQEGTAKVLDLDIARAPGRGPRQGTREYMPPEQVQGGALTSATDVWAIGAVLYEAATAHLPFDFDTDPHAYPQLTGPAMPLRRRGRHSPLASLLAQALHADPAARPTVPELTRRLEALAGLQAAP